VAALTAFLLLTVLFSCCGSCYVNYVLLIGSSVTMFAFLIMAVGALVWFLVSFLPNLPAMMQNTVFISAPQKRDYLLYTLLDVTQRDLGCCGLSSPKDWSRTGSNNSSYTGDLELPSSCCPSDAACHLGSVDCHPTAFKCKINTSFSLGCLNKSSLLWLDHRAFVGQLGIGVTIIFGISLLAFFLLVILSCWARTLRNRRRKRNMLDTTLAHHWTPSTTSDDYL